MRSAKPLFVIAAAIALLTFTFSCADSAKDSKAGPLARFSQVEKEFRQPSGQFRTVPFFVWNGRITKPEINAYLKDFADAGCGGVFIHARPGLITSYLTDEWHELFRYTLDQGKKLGLDVWIYDEYNFPSGFAGGNVPAQMPESYNQGQGLMLIRTDTLPDDLTDIEVVLKEENGIFTQVGTPSAEQGTPGNWWLFRKAWYNHGDNDYYFHGKWYGGFTYVDVLVPGVTEKFIKVTMDGYKQWCGDEFGKSMPGIFTDEPHLNSPGGIRWTPDLFDRFAAQWGYDLRTSLPSLFEEVGDWKQVRHNYSQTVLELFIERWAKPYYRYCEENGLLLTGHYWEHNWPHIRLGPDNMAMYPWMQVPGVDCLFNQFNETSTSAQFGNVRSVKELASVANQFGRTRTLSESYGGAGWDLTFEDMKRLGDWEYALGVNMMNQHMSPITELGLRKYDHPPHFNYQEPWWEQYGVINNYFARLSVALSSGKQINRTLVIEPTTSAWMYDSYARSHPRAQEIGNSFQQFVTTLEKEQVEFDLGSENILRENGSVKQGKLKVGQREYSAVVIPPLTENLNSSTVSLLRSYVKSGGRLYLQSVPGLMAGKPSGAMDSIAEKYPDQIIRIQDPADLYKRLSQEQEIQFEGITGGDLYHHQRLLDDGRLVFLVNSSQEEPVKGSFTIPGKAAVMMNAFDGSIAGYASVQVGRNRLRISFDLPPAGSLLLYISGSKIKENISESVEGQTIQVDSDTVVRIERQRENVLMMDFCDLEVKGKIYKDLQVLDACDLAYRENGFPEGNPWEGLVQYNSSLVSRDTLGEGSGYSVTYRFRVEGSFDHSCMKAVVERPDLFKVRINGQEVSRKEGEWWLDRGFGVFEIGPWVTGGNNELVLSVFPMKLEAEIDMAYITGNFSVLPDVHGWKITPPATEFHTGSWSSQGMPFYPWGVSYGQSFELQDTSGTFQVEIDDWKGTVATVEVNGRAAGVIGFPPYHLDVTGFIKPGRNEVKVTITGSLKNLWGPFHNNPPAGLSISPLWRNVKGYPSGKEYQIKEYGLFSSFRLLNNRRLHVVGG